jgi:methyltransferase (TIGR00027 family)
MEKNKVSRTALLMAYCRGYHAVHDDSKIFDDFLAYRLLPEEDRVSFHQEFTLTSQQIKSIDPASAALCYDEAAALAWNMRSLAPLPLAVSRARYSEDSLKKAESIQQYVILGAGLDTFAFRHSEIVEKLQVFEVDHISTQSFKHRRLAEMNWKIPANLHFVPIDFTQESLTAVLMSSSYNPQLPSFFSWMGVTYYLTRDEVLAILLSIANIAPPGSMIIFDYMDTDAFDPERASNRVQAAIEYTRQQGEPMKTGFDPSTFAADLAPLGLRLYENLSSADIEELYFHKNTNGYHAYEHMNFACAIVE